MALGKYYASAIKTERKWTETFHNPPSTNAATGVG